VGGDVPVDSKTLLVTDFMNLKIKLVQSFKYTYRDNMYVHVFIWFSTYTYINIYTVFLKKSVLAILFNVLTNTKISCWGQ
jgi:hypothetical protein